ncbi:hypothetical protein CFP56_039496 [Quercus suber]|uniref:Uncharacterized protein n=1 Tax=Quercus suber TaxID=58331 RepID=A0AAW0IZF9_QUESU
MTSSTKVLQEYNVAGTNYSLLALCNLVDILLHVMLSRCLFVPLNYVENKILFCIRIINLDLGCLTWKVPEKPALDLASSSNE